MTPSKPPGFITVSDYLAGEELSDTKHEYLGGTVHAMADTTIRHNNIAGNCLGFVHGQLRGKPCQPYNSDTKVRTELPNHTRFYYPDTMDSPLSVTPDSMPPSCCRRSTPLCRSPIFTSAWISFRDSEIQLTPLQETGQSLPAVECVKRINHILKIQKIPMLSLTHKVVFFEFKRFLRASRIARPIVDIGA